MSLKSKKNLGMLAKIAIGLFYTIPIWIAFIFSIHPNKDFYQIPISIIPKTPTLENFIEVFREVPFLDYYKNTLIMLVICIPCQLVLSCLSAYAFTYFSFPFRDTLFAIYLTAMMIPGEVTFVVNYTTVINAGLINTYLGLCVTSLCGVGSIFLLRQNMLSIPKELWEAAMIDGCGKVKYLFKVVIPLSKSVLSAMTITSFISVYNSYLWPLMVTTEKRFHPLQVGVAALTQENGNKYGLTLAGVTICMVIPMIVFVFGQEKIVSGMTAGAVKN